MPTKQKTAHLLRDGQTLAGLAVFVFAAWMSGGASASALLALGIGLTLVVLFGHLTLTIPGKSLVLSVSEPVIFALLLFGGPWPATCLAGIDGFFSSSRHTKKLRLRAANGAVLTLSMAVAGLVFATFAPAGFRHLGTIDNRLILPMLVASLTFFLVNTCIISLVNAVSSGRSPLATWREMSWTFLSSLFSSSIALVIWVLYTEFGALALAAGLPTLGIIYLFFRSYVEGLTNREKHHEELKRLHEQMMGAFALAIDSRNPRAEGHARRVQAYAEAMGRLLMEGAAPIPGGESLDESWIESLSAAALMHDIGKLGIPDQLLNKTPAGLSPSELESLKRHTTLGAAILGGIPFPHRLDPAIRHHHERWDGTGYPDGLRDEKIPLTARIVALADRIDHLQLDYDGPESRRFDALRSGVARLAGSDLDPLLAELFCQHAETIEAAAAARLAERGMEADPTMPIDAGQLTGFGQAHREAGVLYDLARQLGETLDLRDTSMKVLDQLVELIPADSCALYLFDPERGSLVPRAALGPLATALLDRSFSPGEGITGWSFEVGEPVMDADPRIDLGWDAENDSFPVRTEAVFPIPGDGSALGVIAFYAQETGTFTGDHHRVVESAMPQIAHALRNALLFESTQTSSMTDALTGLPNSRFLYGQLEKEIARTTRKGLPLVVVVLDLDGFKPINDTYGHQIGDEVLRRVATIFRETFRQGDIVCRYAGDEFVAILPETSPDEAEPVVRRVQQRLSAGPLEVTRGGETVAVRVGVSAGFSCFPLDGSTLEELVHRADKEMYRDKTHRHAATGPRKS